MERDFDVIVVGGGHAGVEAGLVCARTGHRTLLATIYLDMVARMSCNPAIGGTAKGQLVREIDALGGEMGRCIDRTGIHFRMLNRSKGPAVHSPRAQADRVDYQFDMKRICEAQDNLVLKQLLVEDLLVHDGEVVGVRTALDSEVTARAVIVCPGTFLRGLLHYGLRSTPGGRGGEIAAVSLTDAYKRLGFEVNRLKTGTCPRVHRRSLNLDVLVEQPGDEDPRPFSFSTPIEGFNPNRICCYRTSTNERTHEVIRRNLDRSPLFSGRIEGVGTRYCPSIEDKVMKFPEKTAHHVFLEPEGLNTAETYVNGLTTSLPEDVQLEFLKTVPGMEEVEIIRPGYAVEYDIVQPTQLKPSLETRLVRGLFHAGQINGTSGYEEAAGQGICAGLNALRYIHGDAPVYFSRHESYLGVMIDDLVTRGVMEPYRLFTSRAEYRLLLRHDNADTRMARYGIAGDEFLRRVRAKEDAVNREIDRLEQTQLAPSDDLDQQLVAHGHQRLREPQPAARLLRRPHMPIDMVWRITPPPSPLSFEVREQVEIRVKYAGYIMRQKRELERFEKAQKKRLPEELDYFAIPGIPRETQERLDAVRPVDLGQAARVPGVRSADVAVLHIYLEKTTRAARSNQGKKTA